MADSAIASTPSRARILDGNALAATVRKEVQDGVSALRERHAGLVPGLTVFIVGSRKDSQTYVRMKKKAAEEAGFHFTLVELAESVAASELLQRIRAANDDASVHGIL